MPPVAGIANSCAGRGTSIRGSTITRILAPERVEARTHPRRARREQALLGIRWGSRPDDPGFSFVRMRRPLEMWGPVRRRRRIQVGPAARIASTNPSARRGSKPSSHHNPSTRTCRRRARSVARSGPRGGPETGSGPRRSRPPAARGTYTSQSKPNSVPRSFRSQTSGSSGARNATAAGGSGGAASCSSSSARTNRIPSRLSPRP